MTTLDKRNSDAAAIQQGACNPIAIANTFIRHCDGLDHPTIQNDPALRLIVHQLAFLMNIYTIDNDQGEYSKLMQEVNS